MNTDERRHFTRARVAIPVTLTPILGGAPTEHTLVDVSLRGISLSPARQLAQGDWCRLSLRLGGGEVIVRLTGEVVRAGGEDLALAVCASDGDSFGHLRSLICYNADDPEMVDVELEASRMPCVGEA